MKIIVVIPAYNESLSVAAVVTAVRPLADEVIVVDDGSSDNTASLALSAGARVLQHLVNLGYGAALISGSHEALARGADIIVHFDADGQFEPSQISAVTAPIVNNQVEVVFGSRFLGEVVNISWLRLITLKLAIYFTWFLSGIKLTDAHNGFRATSRAAWQKMKLHQSRMAFSSEIVDEVARQKLHYQEVPVKVRYTTYSRAHSQQGSWPALKIIKDIFWNKFLS
ncbi:MAG: glycosyltransferase family 2 protein [Candidatus Kerfeldbacteria bacterium]|nr:glycosyltransferase family 2 protein [Candidatus Kerfeldbacteria bacterium]